jgi:hypothetical protein
MAAVNLCFTCATLRRGRCLREVGCFTAWLAAHLRLDALVQPAGQPAGGRLSGETAGGRVSFDPNLRPELMGIEEARSTFARFIAAADLLVPTAGEAQALSGIADDDRAASALLGNSNQVLVYKRGAAGCSVYAGGKRLDAAGFQVEEVDPTGAGDCFNAAFLVGLEEGSLSNRWRALPVRLAPWR